MTSPALPREKTSHTERRNNQVAIHELVGLLARPLGYDTAFDLVSQSLREAGLKNTESLSARECRTLLDTISHRSGMIAIAANLAKVTLLVHRDLDID
jgi:hypothetical protein